MKHSKNIRTALFAFGFALGLVALSGSASVRAQSNSATVNTSANVWCALSVNNSTTLAFGNVVGGESPSVTVSIDASSTFNERYGTGADPGQGNRGTPRNQGEIDLAGAEGFLWNLTSAPTSVSLSYTGNGTTDLTSATLSYSSTSGTLTSPSNPPSSGSCDGAGKVYVGGQITLDANTGSGAYSGTVNVTAAYN